MGIPLIDLGSYRVVSAILGKFGVGVRRLLPADSLEVKTLEHTRPSYHRGFY